MTVRLEDGNAVDVDYLGIPCRSNGDLADGSGNCIQDVPDERTKCKIHCKGQQE